jgi:uncharacterized protein (TIGR02594 family)
MRKKITYMAIFISSIIVAKDLTINELRVKYNYQKCNYQRSFLIAKNNLKGQNSSPLVSYCYAISLFKIQEQHIKSNVLDRVLNYLKISKIKPDENVNNLIEKDSIVLNQIKNKAIEFSEEEIKKFPNKSIKRLETIISIYGDTAEIYKVYKIEEEKLKDLKNMIKDSVLYNKINSIKSDDQIIYSINKMETKLLVDTLEKLCEIKLTNEQKQVLKTAFQYNCVSRYPKNKNNPQILEFFHDIGFKKINDDEISWCAAFVNYCLKKSGYNYSHSLLAKDWLKNGIEIKNPLPGDVVVFWRGKKNGWQGHVAFYIKEDKENNLIYAYGGNQDGTVCLKPFPKSQVLAYRRAVK